MSNNICVIPARGGSKRIPRKNIREFCGKPIIAWSIEVALESGCFEQVVVSTDDPEIAEIAKHFGAVVPFIRPSELSDDYTGTSAVVAHSIFEINKFYHVDFACCIYATAPFVKSGDIKSGFQLLSESDADFAFAVTSFPFPIQRAIRINRNNRMEMFYPEHYYTRSQDLEEAYQDAGQFYWGRASAWLQQNKSFSDKSLPIILPRYRVQDIDTMEDWERAERLFKVEYTV
jgi:pseudaminic acid cytidylyltransferase